MGSVVGLNAKGEQEKFPQVWLNKISADLFVVMPWMQVMTGDDLFTGMFCYSRVAIGALAQIGWLIENGKGVSFGIGLNAEKFFESFGEL